MKKECRFCGGELSGGGHSDPNHRWGNCLDSYDSELTKGLMEECRFCGEEITDNEYRDTTHRWGACIELNLLLNEIQTADSFTSAQLSSDILNLTKKMNTLDAHEQTMSAYAKAADDIINVFTDFGFTTKSKFDEAELAVRIIYAIKKNTEGNTTYGPDIR